MFIVVVAIRANACRVSRATIAAPGTHVSIASVATEELVSLWEIVRACT